MGKSWIAVALSFVTIAGGHFYNRRPYTAVLFLFFVVALQSVVDMAVPLFEMQDPASAFQQMMWLKTGILLLVAIASAFVAFVDARRVQVKEGEELAVLSSIAGILIGLGFAVMTLNALAAALGFNPG